MGALRKAGVWLGLVEDEDDRVDDGLFDDEFGEDDDFATAARPRSLARPAARAPERDARDLRRDDPRRDGLRRDDVRHDLRREDLRDREREARERDAREREERELRELRAHRDLSADARTGRGVRGTDLPEPRAGEPRASVRQLARPSGPSTGSTALSYPIQDNLALAPQVQLRERAVVSDDKTRRPQITTLHPTTYSEARAIGERFRDGHPVIMNLTEMDEPDAKRLVDFAAGLAFGLRGGMERVTNRVFLLSPANVQVSAEEKARIADGDFFDQD
jgi:cell division inhibitor SepF